MHSSCAPRARVRIKWDEHSEFHKQQQSGGMEKCLANSITATPDLEVQTG